MPNDDKTIFDSGATKEEGTTTIMEGLDITSFNKNSPINRGDILLSTYCVESEAIEGGMGSVWRVHHKSWNTDLAMKRPKHTLFQTPSQIANFTHECEAWINLGLHPNIVSCYYVRNLYGVPTIFSEWMDGGSLESAIKNHTLYSGTDANQRERILDIAIQFARGLHYAHEAGLIHQDVKPDNVLLTKNFEAKVADFGLSQARAHLTMPDVEPSMSETADKGKTMMSPSSGYTPAYCSMEQMDGKALTRRTDIYSWAVSVLEMYVGFRPWANGVVAGMTCQRYFSDARVHMPEELKELLAKCMNSEPDDRPHDFAEIETKLHDIYSNEIGKDYPRPKPKAAADTADSLNNRALSFLDLGKNLEAERLWEMALEKDTNNGLVAYNKSLHLWRIGAIDDISALGTVRARDSSLLKALEAECSTKLLSSCGEDVMTNIWIKGFSLSHSGDRMLLIDCNPQGSPECKLVDTSSMDVKCNLYSRMYESCLDCAVFTPNDEHILTAGLDGLVLRWNSETGKPVDGYAGVQHPIYPNQRSEIYAIDTLKDGSGFVTGDAAGNFITRKFAPEDETRIINTDSDRLNDIHVSKDGTLVAAAGRNNAYLWEINTGRLIKKFHENNELFMVVRLTEDGKTLITGGNSGRIQIWDVETGVHIREITHHRNSIQSIDISPDGRLLLSASVSGIKLHEYLSGICLCTYEGVIGTAENVCARFAKDGKSVYISRLKGVVARYSLPSGEAAPYLVAKITETKKVSEEQREFANSMSNARRALLDNRYAEALRSLNHARSIPAYHNVLECIKLNFELSKHLKIDGINGVVPLRELACDNGCYSIHSLDDGETFVTVGYQELKYWSWSTGELIKSVSTTNSTSYGLAVRTDGLIAHGDYKGNVGIMDTSTGVVFWMSEPYHKVYNEDDIKSGAIKNLAFSPDGKWLYSLNDEGNIGIWNILERRWERTMFSATDDEKSDIFSFNMKFDLSQDGNTMAIAINSTVKVIYLNGITKETVINDPRLARGIAQVKISPDGSIIITTKNYINFYVWKTKTGEFHGEITGSGDQFSNFTADGRFFFTGGRLYEISSLSLYNISDNFKKGYISPDGESVLCSHIGSDIMLWRIDYDTVG